MAFAVTLHVLAVVVWVGGMFFAYMALRPAAATMEPPQRLPLWSRTFARFFPWVWVAVLILPLTGYWMIFAVFGGFKHIGLYIHLMQGIGIVMIMIYLHVFFAPYRRLKEALMGNDFTEGARRLGQIRQLIGWNLLLGLSTIVIAVFGKHIA